MGTGILPEFPNTDRAHTSHSAPHGNKQAGLVRDGIKAQAAAPRGRMRILHFENTFGEVQSSEYCLDAMLSLVLLMARNSKPDANRLARLTGAARATHSLEDSFILVGAAIREAATLQRASAM